MQVTNISILILQIISKIKLDSFLESITKRLHNAVKNIRVVRSDFISCLSLNFCNLHVPLTNPLDIRYPHKKKLQQLKSEDLAGQITLPY